MLLVTLNGMKLLPNDHFDLMSKKRSPRGRAIINKKNGLGKNTAFELVRTESATIESTDSLDLGVSKIV
jgi:hypothetical protein